MANVMNGSRVSVRIFEKTNTLNYHGYPVYKCRFIQRKIRFDFYTPYVQYNGQRVYIRPAQNLNHCYEECLRNEARL